MKTLINTLRTRKTGYGHFKIAVEINNEIVSTITTNTLAVDAAFDEDYDSQDNSQRFYESREQAQEALVSEILAANYIEFITE